MSQSHQALTKSAAVRAVVPMRDDQLTARHRLMAEYMVHGLSHETLRSRLVPRYLDAGFDADGAPLQKLSRPEVGEALTLEDAAIACGIRLRAARSVSKQPVFQRLLAAEMQAFREGAKARAMRRVDKLAHDPGGGTAADRKVQLEASKTVLGEQDRGTTVNVGLQLNQTIAAGIVVERFEPRVPKTIEQQSEENP